MIKIMFVCHGNICRSPMAVLESHKISPDGKCAVQLKQNDYDKYDLFIGMDSANIRNMKLF